MKNKKLLLFGILFCQQAIAQQYQWVKNNGAAASLSSGVSISTNSNNETWVIPSTAASSRFYGAGNGTAPDIGPTVSGGLERYDANMNLVWSTSNSTGGSVIAADPLDPTQFYLLGSLYSNSTTIFGYTFTGQPSNSAVYLAHCKASGTNGITASWVVKIDGSNDDVGRNLRVKDIGGNHVRIAVQGSSNSASISTYSDGTTGLAQTVATPGGGTLNIFVCSYDEYRTGGTGTPTIAPLWINTFGNSGVTKNGLFPIELNDAGDVLFATAFGYTPLGSISYTLNNSSGTAPGTLTNASYPANNTNYPYILFRFASTDGTVAAVKSELSNVSGCTLVPFGLAADAAGNVYMFGNLQSTYSPGGTSGSIVSAGSADLAVVVFDNNLSPLRAQRYGNSVNNTCPDTWPNIFALDRANNRLYMTGYTVSPTPFTAGTATISQQSSGSTGFTLAAASTGLMLGISAVSCVGSVASSTQIFGAVVLRPDGNLVACQQYSVTANNQLNGATTPLLPKTAYGYQDVVITQLNGGASGTLLNPINEGGWGGSTSNYINASCLKGAELLSAGNYNGTMTVGGTTITGAGIVLVATDTATGNINSVHAFSQYISNMKVSPIDGSIYLVGQANGDIVPYGSSGFGKSLKGQLDAFVMKLDASYNKQWLVYLAGDANSVQSSTLDLDPATGDVYLGGIFNSSSIYLNAAGAIAFGTTAIASNKNTGTPLTGDIFVAKFNPSGTFQWITTGGSSSTASSDKMTKGLAFMNGGVFVGAAAVTNSTFSMGGQSVTTSSTSGNPDMVMARLDAATGSATWLKNWTGASGDDEIASLAAYNNLVYVGGYSNTQGSSLSLGGKIFSSLNGNDIFVFAVDAAGNDQPGLVQISGNGNDYIYEIQSDGIGNIFFAGNSSSSSLSLAGSTLGTSGGSDCLTGAIDAASMTVKFGFLNGSVNGDGYNTVTPGKAGTLFTGGQLTGTATFGGTVVPGRAGGDFIFARIDYPFIAPGAQLSNLNAWYEANSKLIGSPATAWANSTINGLLTNLAATGTVPVNVTGLNYNPTINVSGSNYLSQGGIYSPNFLDASGNKFSIYTVLRPSSASDKLMLWGETTTNTGLAIGAAGNTVTGTSSAVTATNTTALSTAQYSIASVLINGSDINNYVNGAANGSQTGVTPLSTTNPGTFMLGGTGSMDVAELAIYGGAHTVANPPINRVESYLAIKYGITIGHHYYSTLGDTIYKYTGNYLNNIAGIGIDSNEVLVQKQGVSQNTAAKGNMLAIGIGAVAATNLANASSPTKDVSYLVWGDNGGGVATTTQSNLPTGIAGCAYRLPRQWKMTRTGTGAGATQIRMDMNATGATSTNAADYLLLIDRDGDGDLTTGTVSTVYATSYSGGVATFDGINWDTDSNGSDVFALVVNASSIITAPALLPTTSSVAAPEKACLDINGFHQYVDAVSSPTQKYMAINTNGNTGYNFTVYASNDSAGYIGNQRKTDGTANTTALMNRMYTIKDAGNNSYAVKGGMTVRIYYSAADSSAAVAALDPAITGGIPSFAWFKVSGNTSLSGSVATAKAAQTYLGLNDSYGATLITPARYGMEGGIRYVEFDGIQNFSTFGAMAKQGTSVVLPLTFISNTAIADRCEVKIGWSFSTDVPNDSPSFTIERGSDGMGFQPIANIGAGSGRTNYTDATPQPGTWFYRIRAISIDGNITYSSIMGATTAQCGGTGMVDIYPNPAANEIQIVLKGAAVNGRYELLDAAGRLVSAGTALASGNNTINVSIFPTGTYFVRISVNGNVSTQKINIIR